MEPCRDISYNETLSIGTRHQPIEQWRREERGEEEEEGRRRRREEGGKGEEGGKRRGGKKKESSSRAKQRDGERSECGCRSAVSVLA